MSAAVALLDRARGRPHQALEVGINRASLDEMSDAELLSPRRPTETHGFRIGAFCPSAVAACITELLAC